MIDRIAPRYAEVDTPLGRGFYAYTARGVALLGTGVSEKEFLRRAREKLGAEPVRRDPPAAFAKRVREAVERGDGSVVDWDALPAFQRSVLRATAGVPAGSVASYGQIAAKIGVPRASRAVGTALARNPVPLLVPCHRVVQAGGRIGNYGLGGSTVKRRLLAREGALLA